ncbi:MAG TPA: hypothetical protein DEH25_04510 [Chloroflexi bacterium]|nr:hypothetical protein [Chloroflexota bacterium]
MNNEFVFYPPKRAGIIFHLTAIAALTLGGAWGLWQAVHASVGPTFLLYLLPFLAAVPLVPFLIYRLNNLENANYTLERDSLRLRWGLRLEVIPMAEVQWIRPYSDIKGSLRLPHLRWPGALLGTRRLPGGTTSIEYLAAQARSLLVIATPGRLYAISPANPDEFLQAYQHFTELGSLLPPAHQSVHPTIVVSRLWQNRPARYLILAGALSGLAVLVWASLATPGLEQVYLGFAPDGTPRPPIPSIRLMMLPILNSFTYFVNLFLGMSLFRRRETQALAYLLWGASIFVSILFLTAIYFIL